MKKILALSLFFTAPALAQDDFCTNPPPRNCDFYARCLETAQPCGSEGYAIGYGQRYCERFRAIKVFSSSGNAWRDATMSCLQKALIPIVQGPGTQCEAITDYAFDSHPTCYTQKGASICSLPVLEAALVVKTIDAQDLLSQRGRKQIVEVARICIGGIFESFDPNSYQLLPASRNERDQQAKLRFWRDVEAGRIPSVE